MGLDIGSVRIGVALSDPLGIIAQPYETIQSISLMRNVKAVCTLAEKAEAVRIIVGLPLNQHGEVGLQAKVVLEFVERLQANTKLEVLTQDERYSTAGAQRALIEADVSRKGRKQVIDKVAAVFILQTWLDRQANQR